MIRGQVAALFALIFLSACSTLHPTRTLVPKGPDRIDCSPISDDGSVPDGCQRQIIEFAENYTLYFAEFDDQGRPYSDIPKYGQAHKQVETFLKNVHESLKPKLDGDEPKRGGVSVVVFAHGWLHSAKSDDQNLRDFRKLLHQLREVEEDALCNREVIGLYIGWRGEGTKMGRHPYDTLSFWSRKLAAEQIATGSFQRIPAELRTIQSQTSTAEPARTFLGSSCARLKTTYVGHSFGGLIMMSSMSQNMINEVAESKYKDTAQHSGSCFDENGLGLARPDELVIAINPAIEGARFDALFRMASDSSPQAHCYRSPKFLAITSRNDWATGSLFPLGRTLNTLTKRYPEGDKLGSSAARLAVGHDDQYLTRNLVLATDYDAPGIDPTVCNSWYQAQTYQARARIEIEQASALYKSSHGGYNADSTEHSPWPRTFCASRAENDPIERGVMVMSDYGPTKKMSRNVPVWNVRTQDPIIISHGDITNTRLLEFLRQIYIDTMFFR